MVQHRAGGLQPLEVLTPKVRVPLGIRPRDDQGCHPLEETFRSYGHHPSTVEQQLHRHCHLSVESAKHSMPHTPRHSWLQQSEGLVGFLPKMPLGARRNANGDFRQASCLTDYIRMTCQPF
jgi:hypothetical protein